MKHRFRLAILLAALVPALCRPARALADVDGNDWYAEAVAYCVEHGLMTGVSPKYFGVERAVTRAQIVTVLYRLADSPPVSGENIYRDVTEGAWYETAVRWARETGLTTGVSPRYFGADTPLTREQLALFLFRFAGSPPERGAMLRDAPDISPWAEDAVAWVRAVELMRGVSPNRFAPGETVTRAQLASVLCGYAERMGASGAQPEPVSPSAPTAAEAAEELAGLNGTLAPVSLAPAEDGALYCAETGANRIVKIENGTAAPLAGGGESGFRDGTAPAALFSAPQGVAVDADGAVYISDTANGALRRLRNGTVETLIAPTGGTDVKTGLVSPTGLLLLDGKLYVCDRFSRKIFLYPVR